MRNFIGCTSNMPATMGYMERPDSTSEPRFPEWFADIPMDIPKQTPVPIGETGKAVPASVLMNVLGVKIGDAVGALSMDPGLARAAVEQTGNQNWQNLAPEPTIVTRTGEDAWQVRVGDTEVTMAGEHIIEALARALQDSVEQPEA